VRVLFDVLSIVLVELGQIFRPGGVIASVSMDHRLARREEKRQVDSSQRRVQVIQVSHDYELHQGVPERVEPGESNREDQDDGQVVILIKVRTKHAREDRKSESVHEFFLVKSCTSK